MTREQPTKPDRTPFGRYADWYDAFNPGKSYDAEVRYVLEEVAATGASPTHWLDVGCGTGHHLASLHARGIAVEGVDQSPTMIESARQSHPDIPFHVASAQSFALEQHRDVISMLFHVFNYQISDALVDKALERIREHLAPKGLLVFDFWNSDAVKRDPPASRVRQADVEGRPLFRLGAPTEEPKRRLIHVHYQFRWDSPHGSLAHEEVHSLRHFDQAELASFLNKAGFAFVKCVAWLTTRPLCPDDWYGFVVARLEKLR
jgi:SAM-dependent methyltransferase